MASRTAATPGAAETTERLTPASTRYTKYMASTNNPESIEAPSSVAESIWDQSPKTQPIEVWLSQRNFEVTGWVVYESERTDHLKIESLSVRGAQREVTGFLIQQGYAPAGRWEIERTMDGDQESPVETSRRFKPDGASPNQLTSEWEVEPSVGPSPKELTENGEFYVGRKLDQHFCSGRPRLLLVLQSRARNARSREQDLEWAMARVVSDVGRWACSRAGGGRGTLQRLRLDGADLRHMPPWQGRTTARPKGPCAPPVHRRPDEALRGHR